MFFLLSFLVIFLVAPCLVSLVFEPSGVILFFPVNSVACVDAIVCVVVVVVFLLLLLLLISCALSLALVSAVFFLSFAFVNVILFCFRTCG